jgi:toxin ParE1/3/4
MPKPKLRFTTAAQRDLNDIFEYLKPRNPVLANSVINAIEYSINLLTEYPMSARKTDTKDVRVKPLIKYPFLIFYHTANSDLTILRVWHSSREWPGELNE